MMAGRRCSSPRIRATTIVAALIEAGADVSYAENGLTPLCIAAQTGHEAVVRALIEAGAVKTSTRHLI